MERTFPAETMKIAFLRTDDLTGLDLRQEGGSYSHIGGFVRALQKLGHSVFFIASGIPSDIRDGSVPLSLIEYPSFFRGIAIPDFSLILYNFRLIPKALRILRKEKPDFIYQRHSAFNCSGVTLSRLFGIPLILEVNASEVWVQANWGRLYLKGLCQHFEEVAFLGADAIVAISEVVRQDLLRLGVDGRKIVINPNGVDPDVFHPEVDGSDVKAKYGLQGKIVVGFLGTFGVWHGVPVLAEAIKPVIDKNPEIHFLLIGDGSLRPAVEKKIEEDGARLYVTLPGIVPHEEVPNLLAACDILVSSHVPLADGSEFFGSPTKLFEYMAMGKGIVASRLGQIAEVLRHEENALLVEPGNKEELVEGILRLADDEALRKRLGTQARRDVVNRYTWRRNAERVIEVAGQLLAQQRHRGARPLKLGEPMSNVTAKKIREFWERNPLAAADIPFEPGTKEFFEAFEGLRQVVEPEWVQREIYEYDRFQGKAILDVGCGNGYVLSRYAQWGAIATGIDLTWRAVEITRKRFEIYEHKGSFVQGDAEALPFQDESFDLVTAMGVLHHIPDPETAIREIHRVLKPGGRFVMMLYHKDSFYYRICFPLYRRFHKKFRGWSSEDLVKHVDGADNPLGKVYTRHEAKQLVRPFQEVRVYPRSLPQNNIPKIGRLIPQGILDGASRWIGWFLYVKALK